MFMYFASSGAPTFLAFLTAVTTLFDAALPLLPTLLCCDTM